MAKQVKGRPAATLVLYLRRFLSSANFEGGYGGGVGGARLRSMYLVAESRMWRSSLLPPYFPWRGVGRGVGGEPIPAFSGRCVDAAMFGGRMGDGGGPKSMYF